MENQETQQYRQKLAEKIKQEPDKGKRREILKSAKETEPYKQSKEVHQTEKLERETEIKITDQGSHVIERLSQESEVQKFFFEESGSKTSEVQLDFLTSLKKIFREQKEEKDKKVKHFSEPSNEEPKFRVDDEFSVPSVEPMIGHIPTRHKLSEKEVIFNSAFFPQEERENFIEQISSFLEQLTPEDRQIMKKFMINIDTGQSFALRIFRAGIGSSATDKDIVRLSLNNQYRPAEPLQANFGEVSEVKSKFPDGKEKIIFYVGKNSIYSATDELLKLIKNQQSQDFQLYEL